MRELRRYYPPPLIVQTALTLGLGLVSCASDESSNTNPDASNETDAETDTDEAPSTPSVCDAPPLADVASPTAVVGTGTPESCTAAALMSAVAAGGIVTFDCGAAAVTIIVSDTVVITAETVIDGGGRITLSGDGATRILYLDSAYDLETPRLTVQRLTFEDGRSVEGGDDTAVGGGAIYRDGGSLTVNDCVFKGNRAPTPGQDIAGGAIYGFGGGETVIAGSTFEDNTASNGGAVGSLNSHLTVINSVFYQNSAEGTEGNPGNGGCGGAIYMDGTDEETYMCGVTIAENRAGAIGGGVFRVSNDNSGAFEMHLCAVDRNGVIPSDSGNAGGLYLQGLELAISQSTISRNEAFYNGGIWIHTCSTSVTNVTIAENTAFGSNGGGIWLSGSPTGTLLNCTIANNHATADDQIAGAIFGEGLTLKNTVVSGNTAMWVPGCNATHPDGGGNLQWPDGALCTEEIQVADPILGSLSDNGGETETLMPAEGGPAVGVGSDCPATDQRGIPRSTPCTAGAVEAD